MPIWKRRPPLRIRPLASEYWIYWRLPPPRPCKLRIVSDSFPGALIHERELEPSELTDGPHDAQWDGEITASGKHQGQRLASAYSPASVEIVHDQTYRDQAPFTIRRRTHIVELEDIVFATGRAILLPDTGAGAGASMAERGGLDAVAAVLRHAAEHSDQTLALFGHTDTVGSDSNNLELSEHRATNALHVVTGDADAWAQHCDEHFDVADEKRVLAWIARTFAWATDPGEIDGEFGPMTREARAAFRERMNAEYGTALQDGARQGPDDWKAYFTLYDEELTRLLDCSREELDQVRADISLTQPAAIGCGESWPAEGADQNNLESASNRRVDFVFFEPDEVPVLPGDPPGQELYGTKAYRADYIPYESSPVVIEASVRRLELGYLEYRRGQLALLPALEASRSPWAALIAAARHIEAAPEDTPALFFHQHADEHDDLSRWRAEAG